MSPRPLPRRRSPKKGDSPEDSRAAQGLGKSRGGLSTKVHTICEGTGHPLATTLTPGQDSDTMQLPVLLGLVRVNKPGPGRPRTRLNSLAGDKAYLIALATGLPGEFGWLAGVVTYLTRMLGSSRGEAPKDDDTTHT